MGQSGSSELRIAAQDTDASYSASASDPASLSSPPARPLPQLRLLRASRAGRGSLTAEWRWSERSEPAGRCHLLFLRSDAPQAGQSGRMRRVPVDPRQSAHTAAGLAEDAPYRVCLQCAAAAAAATLTEAGNRTSARPALAMTAGRPAELMHCVNVSTKQAHLTAIIGSCLGALCAFILVLALVLLSRRSQQYRKVNERQTSAATNKKVVVHEVTYQTENLPTPKLDLDSNSDGYNIYDGSEDQQVSSASDDVLTPPPQPPPPPPDDASSMLLMNSTAVQGKEANGDTAELRSLLANGDRSVGAATGRDVVDTDTEEADVPPTPPPPPLPASSDVEAGASVQASTPVSTSTDGRQVIQVNETDEYSIDLRLCDSLSRQQSVKTSASANMSTGTSVSAIASAGASAGSTSAEVASSADQTGSSAAATPTLSASDHHQGQRDDQTEALVSAPSLYTQLIETL